MNVPKCNLLGRLFHSLVAAVEHTGPEPVVVGHSAAGHFLAHVSRPHTDTSNPLWTVVTPAQAHPE